MSFAYFFVIFIHFAVNRLTKVDASSAVMGSIVQLKCPYRTSGGNRISWFKNIKEPYSEGTNINPKLSSELISRLNVTGDYTAGEYHLSISNVQKSDEGTYNCVLSGISGSSTLQLTVITNIPTSVNIDNVRLDKKLNGIEGRNLMIRCSAVGGDPAPDVKLLISKSVVTVAKSSIQFTLSSVNRSYDGQNVICLAGYEEILFYPLNESARIYLKLKGYPPTFSSDSVITEETKPLVISCTSTGSRPMALIYWLLGDGKTNVTANSTQLPPIHVSRTDTYSVTSTFIYKVDRIHNGQNLICGAANDATSGHGGGVETSKTINVTYAPDITVTSPIYTQNDADITVTCNPKGNPDSYIYLKWQHKSKYGELVREFGGNKTLKIPDVPVLFRYQDTGDYLCTASNGIKDKYNRFEQTGYGFVTVRAQPVFTSDTIDRVKRFGEINKAADMYVNVYSVPKFTGYIWARDGKPITQNSEKYTSSSSPTIVKDKIHGKEVQLDGYNVSLTIRDLKAEDFVNYTVTLKSVFRDVEFTIVLESPSVPDTPGNFTMIASSSTSFTVQWDILSGGGYRQKFYIQYRVKGLFEWTTESSGEEADINQQKSRRTYELRNLQEGKAYELRMYAENTAMKRSDYTDVLIIYTKSSEFSSSSPVIGAAVGVVVTLVVICASVIVILLFKRSQGKDKKEKNEKYYENSDFQDIQKGDEYEEVEIKFDEENKQSSKTYETLGTNDAINVYDDLENPRGVTPSKSSLGHYESLDEQDKPSLYTEMKIQKDQRQFRKQQTGKTQLKPSNNDSKNNELNTRKGPTEQVYANEVF